MKTLKLEFYTSNLISLNILLLKIPFLITNKLKITLKYNYSSMSTYLDKVL